MTRILLLLFLLTSSVFSRTLITVNYPVEAFFLKRIAGNTVYIRTIEEKGEVFDKENTKALRRYSASEYFFTFDFENEKEIYKILKHRNSDIKKINMIRNIPTLKLPNGELNPYIWLDPILVRDMAKNIYESLSKIRSYDKEIYKTNYESFLEELDEIFLDIKKRIDNSDLYGFFAFNHELDYFAKRFRVNIYHKDFRYVKISEVPDLIRFARKEHLKHIVIHNEADYNIALSFSGHINGKIVEYEIYTLNWKVNLYTILRGIENF